MYDGKMCLKSNVNFIFFQSSGDLKELFFCCGSHFPLENINDSAV